MRGLRSKWRRLTAPVAKATALLLLLQFVIPSPCALLAPRNVLLALGGICHVATSDDSGQPGQQPADNTCCHCLACSVGAVVTLPPPTLPGSHIVAAAITSPPVGRTHLGAARLAYASRAPPTIG